MDIKKPDWLRIEVVAAATPAIQSLTEVLAELGLHTVCQSARCPNLPLCWGEKTATFMILGDVCTRACRFCAVRIGWPNGAVDQDEPARLSEAVRRLGLGYVVLTSVDRDDLPDGGASHFAACIRHIKSYALTSNSHTPHRPQITHHPSPIVEALIPDFSGDRTAIARVVAAQPAVVGHNIETVRRLSPAVRDRRASYELSLSVLHMLKKLAPGILTKSSLLLGLGEELDEIEETLRDLRAVEVDIIVLGQYLRPTRRELPVVRYVTPAEFSRWEERARDLGFLATVAGPFARTSFRAAEVFEEIR